MIEPGPGRISALLEASAKNRQDAPFLFQGDRVCSYAAAWQGVATLARQLQQAGLRAGDRLLVIAENSIDSTLAVLAAQAIDAWPALANPRLPAGEIERLRQRIDPRFVLLDTAGSSAAADLARHFGAANWPGAPEGFMLARIDPEAAPEPVSEDSARQTAAIIFTSGSSGVPKAVMHSHSSLIGMGEALTLARQTSPEDTYSGAAPLAHVMGLSTLMNVMIAGAALRIEPRMSIDRLINAIVTRTITHLSFVPTVYAQLCAHLEVQQIALGDHGVKYISVGGAPLVQALKDRVERLFGLPLANGYGMTECAPGLRSKPSIGSSAANIGFAEPGSEVTVRDGAASAVRPGEVGQIMLRGKGMMLGYYRDPEATAAALTEDGWIATGDLARMNPDGSLEIVGRAKEMIIHNGFNVYPAEVEDALAAQPGVLAAAVVGVARDDGNEEVVAFVQPEGDARVEESVLHDALKSTLSAYKRPSRIHVVAAMPLGPTGKIRKLDLVALARMEPNG